MAKLFTKKGNRAFRRIFKRDIVKGGKKFFTKTVPDIYDKVDKGVKETASFLEANAEPLAAAFGGIGGAISGDPTMAMKAQEYGRQVSQTAGEVQKARGQLRKDLNQSGKDIARNAREARRDIQAQGEMPKMSRGSVFSGVRQGLTDYGRSVMEENERNNMFME